MLTGVEAEYSRLFAEYEELKDSNDKFEESQSGKQLKEKIEKLQSIIGDDDLNLSILRLIGRCGFDALQVANKKDDIHYRCLHRFKSNFGRAVTILCSDAHRIDDVFDCGEGYVPYIKFPQFKSGIEPELFFKYLKEYTLRFGETRFTSISSNTLTCYMKGIEIEPESEQAKKFWPFGEESNKFILSFSQNLNCLIGGRGSGKSAMIEALAFLLLPECFDQEAATRDALEKKQDWYKRAYQTLSGCNVKICWTSTSNEFSHISKRSVFLSRYFDLDQKYDRVDFRNIEGQQVVEADVTASCNVQLYRMSDLENLAIDEKQMRGLFDSICGDKIERINTKIIKLLNQLKEQRDSIKTTFRSLAEITKERSPLRTYVIRKKQYDDVNTAEIREKYERLDQAVKARQIADDANNDWEELSTQIDATNIFKQLTDYFDGIDEKTKDEKGEVLPHTTDLRDALFKSDAEPSMSLKNQILADVNSLNSNISNVSGTLKNVQQSITEVEKNEKDALVRDGLPGGSREREAKKRAYDEAVTSLETYKNKVEVLSEELSLRNRKFQQLKRLARLRTGLRSQTAKNITDELKRNLDASILVIEADARPMADKKEYILWLDQNFFPSGIQAKKARILQLLEAQVFPENLQKILLGDIDASEIANEITHVSDGRINNGEAKQFVDYAKIRWLNKYDEDIQNSGFNTEDLPNEIQNGTWVFSEDQNKVEKFLELDEIVFDDIPEIRLKDRPTEMENARPITELSPGQRCSAILPIILLNGNMPLIIDQPEDNLDNRLIREVVVNILAAMKLRRQVIIATHNANLPVLGDVEQAIILRAVEQDKCLLQTVGDIEKTAVVRSITEIMEGGREAFQYRHSIYKTHWEGPIEEPLK